MKVPISWLKEYVEISLPIEELAYKLTLAGLEVELDNTRKNQLTFKHNDTALRDRNSPSYLA